MNAAPLARAPGRVDRAVAQSTADTSLPPSVRRLLAGRQNVSPKRLVEPGPSDAQCLALLEMAGAAPDHGRLTPWRFVIVPAPQRARLGEVFARALRERDPSATTAQIEAARAKAHHAPWLLLAIVRSADDDHHIPAIERVVSLGAAIQNLLLAAHALGFGSGLVSGQAMACEPMRRLFALAPGEDAACFVAVGTVAQPRAPRVRPSVSDYCSTLA